MWFKQLKIYQIDPSFKIDAKTLSSQLEQFKFSPCSSLEPLKHGWVSPLPGIESANILHQSQECLLICMQTEEKLLPSKVVHQQLEQKIREIEQSEGHKIGKKQKMSLKEEIIAQMLPQAFSQLKKTFAYMDLKSNLLVVNAGSAKQAETLSEFLRKATGSLPIKPLISSFQQKMSNWLYQQSAPLSFSIGDRYLLKNTLEPFGSIRCNRNEINPSEIQNLINDKNEVQQLELIWLDQLSLLLNHDGSLKQLKPLDILVEKYEQLDDAVEQFIADFDLMIISHRQLLDELFSALEIKEATQ